MANKRIFISYDYSNDGNYKDLVLAWDKDEDLDFSFYDMSVEVSVDASDAAAIKREQKRKEKERELFGGRKKKRR